MTLAGTVCARFSVVYNVGDMKAPLSVVGTNISPATLMPFYDPDTHLLYLTGKVSHIALGAPGGRGKEVGELVTSYGCQDDHTILAYEYVADQDPYLFEVTPFSCGSPHQVLTTMKYVLFKIFLLVQAISFLPKTECDVKLVEVARGVRLCQASVEPFTLRVPRVKVNIYVGMWVCA